MQRSPRLPALLLLLGLLAALLQLQSHPASGFVQPRAGPAAVSKIVLHAAPQTGVVTKFESANGAEDPLGPTGDVEDQVYQPNTYMLEKDRAKAKGQGANDFSMVLYTVGLWVVIITAWFLYRSFVAPDAP
ncbi:unnamed protein product [Prorocentrum cordatum]|uniref:Transmembrane protein n=1 Tax=Prorocentrum cordatum TaxID=2364126 RepID=A0ABN9UMW0_9DINO|nr:unnamed protein product [Polarella glacialis]